MFSDPNSIKHIQTRPTKCVFLVSVLAKHAPDQDVVGSVWIVDLGLVLMSLEGHSRSFVFTTLNVKFCLRKKGTFMFSLLYFLDAKLA